MARDGGHRRRSPAQGAVPLGVAFTTPALRRLLLVAATSRGVDLAMLVAVSVELYGRSGATAVAAYGVARTLAAAVGTPMVAAAGGRTAPDLALGACLVAAASAAAGTALLVATAGPVLAIIAVSATASVALGSLRPMVSSLLPLHLRGPDELVATNSAAAGIEAASVVLGPSLAGGLLAASGATPVLAGASAVLLAVALGVRVLRGPPPAGEDRPSLAGLVLDGLRTVVGRGPVRLVAMLVGSQCFVRGALNVIAVGLAVDRLGLGDGGLGLLLGAIGVGGVIGVPVAARAVGGGRTARSLGVGIALWGLPLVAIGSTVQDPVVIALFGVVGVANAVVDISADTLLQRFVPAGRLGAVMGSFEALLFAATAVGAAGAGLLLTVVGPGAAVAITGAVLPLVALAAAVPLTRIDGTVRHRDAGIALLQLNGIFSPLVLAAVDQLSSAAAVEDHEQGEEIVTEGAPGDRFYVIESGQVEVRRRGTTVATLEDGDCFGEVALLDGVPRNAAVVARTPVTTRSLDRASFLAALHADDRSRSAAERLADGRRPSPPDVAGGDARPDDAPGPTAP